MNEILRVLNALTADDLEDLIMRANIILEKKRKEEAEQALREKERLRQERLEQERRRQQEIAELQRKLQELQSQAPLTPEEPVQGENFVMYDSAAAASKAAAYSTPAVQPAPVTRTAQPAAQPAPATRVVQPTRSAPAAQPAQPKPAGNITCPYCHKLNMAGSLFCEKCGKRLDQPVQPSAPRPAAPQPARQADQTGSSVRYMDGLTKKWELLPGENVIKVYPELHFIQPVMERKYVYSMQVTNKRLLISRGSAFAAGMQTAGAMGGGMLGSLIVGGIMAAANAGGKPWLEIPLTAIVSYSLQNKKEFLFVADKTYILKNKGFDQVLPSLIENAKR